MEAKMSLPAILLVDDDPLTVRIFQHIFMKAGLKNPLYVVYDGDQAISYLAGHDKYANRDLFPMPTLVFLDLYMPRKSGHEVLAWIRNLQAFKNLQVVVLTSSSNTTDIEKAYELGANSYLLKPVTAESIKEMVDIFATQISGNKRILLLDDDREMRLLAVRQLRREFPGVTIVEVGLPEELEPALEQGGYDLVVTDYELKWTNGLKLLQIVKTRWPQCPVIMFTGSGSEEIAIDAMRSGLDDYVLKKPKHFARLSGAARLALARSKHFEAAREAEKRYRSLFESVPVGLFRCNIEGRLTDANQTFISMLGYNDMQSLLDLDIADAFVDKADHESLLNYIACTKQTYSVEARIYRRDGSIIWGEIKVCLVCDERDDLLYYDGTFQDITERKHLESQLRQALKMEAIGTLAGGIAHDFNNILTSLMGYASLMQLKLDEKDPLRAYVDQILSASQKAADLTQSLLSFSRQQPVNLVPIDMNETIRATHKLLRRLITEDIELTMSFSKEDAVVMADKSQVDQILFNLVTNARDAMPKGGTLAINTDIVYIDGDFIKFHGFGNTGEYLVVSISDTGVGIDEATLEKIFDPFFTTKEVGKGTGLGLSTVYGIVKQHNGYIRVESVPNHGTSFHIYFPTTKFSINDKKVEIDPIAIGNETILIAEDNREARLFICEALKQCGYNIIEAIDGEDAVNQFLRHKDIDLMIVDSVMPKKNGREVYEEIIKINPEIKTLFTSGYTKDIVIEKEIDQNILSFLPKPMSLNTLLQKVRDVLDS
jgi:PAS domain S-box-containing protein